MRRIGSPRSRGAGRSSIKAKRTPWSNTSNMPCPHFAALSRIVRAYMLAPNQMFRRTWWRIWRSWDIMLASSFELSPDYDEPLCTPPDLGGRSRDRISQWRISRFACRRIRALRGDRDGNYARGSALLERRSARAIRQSAGQAAKARDQARGLALKTG